MTQATKGFSIIELLIILVVIGTVVAAAVPGYATRREAHAELEVATVAANSAAAQERYRETHGTYLVRGGCSELPGVSLPEGVRCRIGAGSHGAFRITTDRPLGADVTCTWDSGAQPNLVCG
ncbi:MAG: hypothetical protein U0807_16060 [Candidatus Binatia bacterium]